MAVTNSRRNRLDLAGQWRRYVPAAADLSVGSDPQGIVVGDFNKDGNLDLAVTNSVSDTVSILLGNGDGTFQPQMTYPVGTEPLRHCGRRLQQDGNLDLAVTNSGSNTVSILLGNGDGTFLASPQLRWATTLRGSSPGVYRNRPAAGSCRVRGDNTLSDSAGEWQRNLPSPVTDFK